MFVEAENMFRLHLPPVSALRVSISSGGIDLYPLVVLAASRGNTSIR